MLAFAVDHPSPATIILITGDRDYAYAVSVLKLRKYQVILVVPSSSHTPPCLESQASLVIDWGAAVLKSRTEPAGSTQPIRQPFVDPDAALVAKLLRGLDEYPLDDPDTILRPASRLRRVTARELLTPSRHSKNTESFDSTQDFTHNPVSPKISAATGLPIPKTPSRSRHASVSTGSTRARSTTTVAQSPPAVEKCTPAKSPPLTGSARRSSTSDIVDDASLAKRNLSVSTSLDSLELPLHDDSPPSSIAVRSPLEPAQSTCDTPAVSGTFDTPSSHKLNCLASPFIMSKAPTELQSVPKQQSQTTGKPASLTMPPTTLAETVTAVCGTPQMKSVGAPKEIDRLTDVRIENNEGAFEQSIPHRAHSVEALNADDFTMFNYHPYVAPHTTRTLSGRNVGSQPADTPASKHVSLPAAGSLGVGNAVDSAQLAASLCAPIIRDHAPVDPVLASPSSESPSAPSTTNVESHKHDDSERPMWIMFKPLIHVLLATRARGILRPSRSIIAVDLVKSDSLAYRRAGVTRFKDYTAMAERAGIIELGSKEADAWIALHPNWFGVDGITTTQFLQNSDASPTLNSPKAAQDPLLTGSETPLIERTAILSTPGASFLALDTSDTLLASPNNRQDDASLESIPVHFQPLVDALVRMRAEGSDEPRRSLVGQVLDQTIYSQAGVSGFKEYIQKASEAQVIEFGGVGGFAWIRLHPRLRI